MTPRDALVRVARFHLRLAEQDLACDAAETAVYFALQAQLCLERIVGGHSLLPIMVLSHSPIADGLEVRVVGEGVFCWDMQAESAPWIEIAADLSYEEVVLDTIDGSPRVAAA